MWRRGTPRSSRGACIPERLRAGGVYLGVDADVARTRSVAACKDFLTFWKDADPDHPICRQAKAEYPKLQCSPRTEIFALMVFFPSPACSFRGSRSISS
jgi:hypothetical protein